MSRVRGVLNYVGCFAQAAGSVGGSNGFWTQLNWPISIAASISSPSLHPLSLQQFQSFEPLYTDQKLFKGQMFAV